VLTIDALAWQQRKEMALVRIAPPLKRSFVSLIPPLGAADPDPHQVVRIVQRWHTECGSCGYGRGGWSASPALRGGDPIFVDSPRCPGCGKTFTHELDPYSRDGVMPIPSDAPATI
jgi:hypothetical protein